MNKDTKAACGAALRVLLSHMQLTQSSALGSGLPHSSLPLLRHVGSHMAGPVPAATATLVLTDGDFARPFKNTLFSARNSPDATAASQGQTGKLLASPSFLTLGRAAASSILSTAYAIFPSNWQGQPPAVCGLQSSGHSNAQNSAESPHRNPAKPRRPTLQRFPKQ